MLKVEDLEQYVKSTSQFYAQDTQPEIKLDNIWIDTTSIPYAIYRCDGTTYNQIGNANSIEDLTNFTTDDLAESETKKYITSTQVTKLDGISENATKVESSIVNGAIKIDGMSTTVYTHPATHSPSIIAQDANNRFVSDAQIAEWNSITIPTNISEFTNDTGYLTEVPSEYINETDLASELDTALTPINASINDLDNRSIIGSQLDYGLFTRSTVCTLTSINSVVTYDTKNGSNMDLSSNGRPILKAGRKYAITFGNRALRNTSVVDFGVKDYTNNKVLTLVSDNTSAYAVNVQGPGKAYYTPTTDCEIGVYVTYYSSTVDITLPTYACYLEVQEVNRTTIIDPCEDGKNIQFEYGSFYPSAAINVTAVGMLDFNTMEEGNMSINTTTKGVPLKAGKTYEINYFVVGEYVNIGFQLKNLTAGTVIATSQGAKGYNLGGDGHCVYTPNEDCEVGVYVSSISSGGIVRTESKLIVREIAQPYYFNYYKDSISSTVLFEGNANVVGDYTLNDNITNYKYLLIEWHNTYTSSTTVTSNYTDLVSVDSIVIGDVTDKRIWLNAVSYSATYTCNIILHFRDSNTLYLKAMSSSGWLSASITKITGIGYNYENPYRDMVSNVNIDTTDAEMTTSINTIWGDA